MSAKSQNNLATEAEFDSPNVITMIKQTPTKVSLCQVVLLERVQKVDPMHRLRLVMGGAMPGAFEVLAEDASQLKNDARF